MGPNTFAFIMLLVSTRANPLEQTSLKMQQPQDTMDDEQVPSLIGDIRYPEGMESKQGILFSKYPGSKWPNNRIPYIISSSDYTTAQQSTINSAILAMNQKLLGCLQIVPRRNEPDYVKVISGNGCYSNLGRIGGQQTLSLQSNGCLSRGTIQHEFIHAVGLTHQHNRPDRDDYVRVLYDNIPDEWRSQYEKGEPSIFASFGQYDYYSVMHYPMKAPGTNKPAFDILASGIDQSRIGQRSSITDKDVRQIWETYNCSSSVPPIG